jgi:hypothetical protein
LGGGRVHLLSQRFADASLERAYAAWFGRGHATFMVIVASIASLFSLSFVFISDLNRLGRSGVRDDVFWVFRSLSTGVWAVCALVGLLRREFAAKHWDVLSFGSLVVAMLSVECMHILDHDIGSVFVFTVHCCIACSPSVLVWTKFGTQFFLVVVYTVSAFVIYDPADAFRLFVAPVLIFLVQGALTSIILDRELRRHFYLCFSSGYVGAQSRPEYGNGNNIETVRLRWRIFLPTTESRSWWRAELAFRHAAMLRDRAFTRLSLVALGVTSLLMLIIEVFVIQGDPDVVVLVSVRVIAVVLPLLIAIGFTTRTIQSSFGLHGGFDALILLCLVVSALSILWLEVRIYGSADTSGDGDGKARWEEDPPTPEPLPPHFLYTTMLAKQLFVLVTSFKLPVALCTPSVLAILALRAVLIPEARELAVLVMVVIIFVLAAYHRERVEKVTFLVHVEGSESRNNRRASKTDPQERFSVGESGEEWLHDARNESDDVALERLP